MDDDKNAKKDYSDIKEYVVAINNYVDTLKSSPIAPTPSIVPQVRKELFTLDDTVDQELETIRLIEDTHYEIERYLKKENAPGNKKFWINLKYGLAKHLPQLREPNTSIAELLLLQSNSILKASSSVEALTQKYDSLSDNLEKFEERLYEQTELLADRKDHLMERISETYEVLEKHIDSKVEKPSERERNSYLMIKNRLSRLVRDMDQQLQLSNQQYVLAMDQLQTIDGMLDYMKEQSGLCKKLGVLGFSSGEYVRETAFIHDTAEDMHVATGKLIDVIRKTGHVVAELADLRQKRQEITTAKTKAYIGNGSDGSEYRKMLEAPTKEARELSNMMDKMNNEKIKKRYEDE